MTSAKLWKRGFVASGDISRLPRQLCQFMPEYVFPGGLVHQSGAPASQTGWHEIRAARGFVRRPRVSVSHQFTQSSPPLCTSLRKFCAKSPVSCISRVHRPREPVGVNFARTDGLTRWLCCPQFSRRLSAYFRNHLRRVGEFPCWP